MLTDIMCRLKPYAAVGWISLLVTGCNVSPNTEVRNIASGNSCSLGEEGARREERRMTTPMIKKIELERYSLVTSKAFDQVLAALNAEIGHPNLADFLRSTREAASPVEVKHIVAKALGRSGLMLFVELDHGGILRKTTDQSGAENVRLVVGNPLIMKEMARHVPDAGSYAPVTILVDARADGIHLSYDRMESLLAPYGNPKASEVARSLDQKVEALLQKAAE